MNNENAENLISLAPNIFGEHMRFSCGDGWFNILSCLFSFISHKSERWQEVRDKSEEVHWVSEYLEKYPSDPYEDFKVTQVKSKFGGLRVYVSHIPEREISGAIAMAERMAWKTCEKCGCPGELQDVNWGRVLCEEDA